MQSNALQSLPDQLAGQFSDVDAEHSRYNTLDESAALDSSAIDSGRQESAQAELAPLRQLLRLRKHHEGDLVAQVSVKVRGRQVLHKQCTRAQLSLRQPAKKGRASCQLCLAVCHTQPSPKQCFRTAV